MSFVLLKLASVAFEVLSEGGKNPHVCCIGGRKPGLGVLRELLREKAEISHRSKPPVHHSTVAVGESLGLGKGERHPCF